MKVKQLMIGYGEGIHSAEDVDVFDEYEGFIRSEENWGV